MSADERILRGGLITRRRLVGGVACSATVTLFPSPAPAFWPAVITGINVLVTLWNGYKMLKEVYQEFFSHRQEAVTAEVGRVYGPRNFTVDDYYRFENSYKVPHLSAAEPGCQIAHRINPNATALCCGTQERPVFLSTGCIIALNAAVDDLSASWADNNVFAYTRPIRYVTPVGPWTEIDPYGIQLRSDLQYYSTSGSVALRWLITNRNARTCRGEYKIRDDTSLRIVAEGETEEFYY